MVRKHAELYAERHPEKRKAQLLKASKKWSSKNKEWKREARKRFTSSERGRAYKQEYERKRRKSKGEINSSTLDYVQILKKDPCAYCGQKCEHIDHIVPLARNGDSNWTNYTAACGQCNQTKYTKSLLEALIA